MNVRYQQAMERFRNYLREQKPAIDTRLPSEREFSQMFGVSRPTVNKAIACLISQGILRRQGYKLYFAGEPPPVAIPPSILLLIPRDLLVNREGPLDAGRNAARERLSHAMPVLMQNADDERETLRRLLSEKINGFVLWPHGPDCNVDLLAEHRRKGTPFVLCEQEIDPFDCVGTDNEAGTAMAVQQLVECGHRDIVYITRPLIFPGLVRRRAGYRQACCAAGLRQAADQIIEIPEDVFHAGSPDAFATLRHRFPKATAFAASNDKLVLQVFEQAQAAGVRVPEELSAVGFDDIAAAGQAAPALTTIRQDFYEIGYLATELLCQRMTQPPQRDPRQPVQLLLKPRLIVRASVAPAAGPEWSPVTTSPPPG